jgi:two-component system CheB/CheR fusion protein
VILSGTASDGAAGLREIKAVGGIAIAQEPETAKYDGMPRAAIATDIVDLVLTPEQIAKELIHLKHHPYVRAVVPHRPGEEFVIETPHLGRILEKLKSATGVDFSQYKVPTIRRRIQRRMALHRLSSVDTYSRYLEKEPDEVRNLYQDILIHVTGFFREPESFKALRELVFPKIVEGRQGGDAVRVWVPGCSTGEEPYSVAIELLDYLGDGTAQLDIQVFATDVSETAVETARHGIYAESIARDVGNERLRRFFTRTDGAYRVNKGVRDLCVFAQHDLTRDPPFSRMDLVVCRNVLIYLGAALQKRLLGLFHYALKPSGFLMLGAAETVGAQADLFAATSRKDRIYTKRGEAPLRGMFQLHHQLGAHASTGPPPETEPDQVRSVFVQANRLLLDRYTPPSVLVDSDLTIIQTHGDTSPYLELPPGQPSLSLLKMARSGLVHPIQQAVRQARRSASPVSKPAAHITTQGKARDVDLDVIPVTGFDGMHFMVIFREGPGVERTEEAALQAARKKRRSTRGKKESAEERRIRALEDELTTTREYLQSVIQDLEAANEELQSANEEILSANEELQSTNEELDTAKEELQSTNEELNTVNEELRGRNEELSRMNSDLQNFLGSVQVAIVVVSRDLRIRSYTSKAEEVLNLIGSDVGRPLTHIQPNIVCPDLEERIHRVIDTVALDETEVRDNQGRWYSLQIRPYKDLDNRISGAVLALIEIDQLKKQGEELRRALDFAQAIVETVRRPLVVLDGELRVRKINKAFLRSFQVSAQETEGLYLKDLGDGQWNIPELRTLLEEVLPRDAQLSDFSVELDFPDIGRRKMLLNARRLEGSNEREAMILLAIEDITDRPIDLEES